MNKHEQEMIEQYWDEAHEKMLESVLVNNEELRGLFETYPERKEEYKFKILDSEVLEAPTPPTNIFCKSCIFQLPPTMIGDKMTSRYNWGKCRVFNTKPHEILYDGAPCEYYEKENPRNKAL